MTKKHSPNTTDLTSVHKNLSPNGPHSAKRRCSVNTGLVTHVALRVFSLSLWSHSHPSLHVINTICYFPCPKSIHAHNSTFSLFTHPHVTLAFPSSPSLLFFTFFIVFLLLMLTQHPLSLCKNKEIKKTVTQWRSAWLSLSKKPGNPAESETAMANWISSKLKAAETLLQQVPSLSLILCLFPEKINFKFILHQTQFELILAFSLILNYESTFFLLL